MTVDHASVFRAVEANGYDDVRVEYAPPAVARVAQAALVRLVEEAARAATADAPGVWAESALPSVAGAAVRLKDLSGPEAVTAWLDAFAARLPGDGAVRAVPVAVLPAGLLRGAEPRLTAYLALDGAFTDDADEAERWCRRALHGVGARPLVATGPFYQAAPPDAATYLATALHAGRPVEVVDAPAARVALNPDGQVILQRYTWEDLGPVRQALLDGAARTRLGLVAVTSVWALDWSDRGRLPRPPHVPVDALARNDARWGGAIPDAHGLMLLTPEHLRRASVPPGWRPTPASGGRVLVEAPDPRAWLRPEGPDDTVLAAARAAFAGLLNKG
ncbi:hypothetical protein Dvina_16770 [Dactylosporangium vinaceum]|uniref:Uncharacterized protein n=1 Tax=Dactylosporangium vinaceum TaxID=53362 RepID=A0ABV5M1H6_9ACTN|nr:hypothetical protein [Dactylosporangium vinaceum]UAB99574.1 hypothetical protein Dvina_16770 [Dactylosporangium vinaceum]